MFNGVGTHHGRDELVGEEAGYSGAPGRRDVTGVEGRGIEGTRWPGVWEPESGVGEPSSNIR
jgi:hypothetical protein